MPYFLVCKDYTIPSYLTSLSLPFIGFDSYKFAKQTSIWQHTLLLFSVSCFGSFSLLQQSLEIYSWGRIKNPQDQGWELPKPAQQMAACSASS